MRDAFAKYVDPARFTVVEVNDEKVPLCLRLATSLAGKIAADLGADVLKIEPTPRISQRPGLPVAFQLPTPPNVVLPSRVTLVRAFC